MTGRAGHGLGPTRARVLRRLQAVDGGMGVAQMALDLQLHNNTARFHLEALVESGYARRGLDVPAGQGRPRTIYHATEHAPTVDTGHLRDLTQVLVHQLILSAPDPEQVAEDVGRAWGGQISRAVRPGPATDAPTRHRETDTDHGVDPGVRELVVHTLGMGFDVRQPATDSIEFHGCPYRDVGQPALASICRVHLGMMRGLLETSGSPSDVESLHPGSVCVARLAPRSVTPDHVEPSPDADEDPSVS